MMYPMISGLDELKQANALLEEYKAELRQEKIPFDENLEVGAMIETPSAAIVADSLAKRVKFFSIGTNDLIQYSLAVDRMNEKIAHLYEPTHPAIVRLIKITVDAAHQHKVRVSVCGEMAGDPVLAPLLLGLGVDELSAAPSLVPPVKFLIRRLKLSEARELATFAWTASPRRRSWPAARSSPGQIAPSLFETQMKVIILAAGYATRLYPAHAHAAQTAAAGRRQADDRLRARQPRAHRRHRPHLRRHQRQVRRPLPAVGRRTTAPHKAKLNFTIVNDRSTDDTNKLGAIGDIHFVLKTQNVDGRHHRRRRRQPVQREALGLWPVLPREERPGAGGL